MKKRLINLEEENINQEEFTQVETIATTEVADDIELLKEIHNDLGVITCFIVFFVLVIILKYSYKFFNMIFNF